MNDESRPGQDDYLLDPSHVDPRRLRKERDRARALKKTQWWHIQRSRGRCHYCGEAVPPSELTMDHVIPLARGGTSTRGNIVASCRACNQKKRLGTPVEDLIDQIP